MQKWEGHGPKRSQWVVWLYFELLSKFQRLKSAGVKFSSKLLQNLACDILANSNSIYHARYRNPKDGRLIIQKIFHSWM
jgi:hypothetical protein